MDELALMLKKKMKDLNIGTRIIIFYSILLICSIVLSNTLYNKIYSNVISKKVTEMSLQTLSSINSTLNSIFSNMNNTYIMLLSNTDLHEALASNPAYNDVSTDRKIQDILLSFHPLTPEKGSIYIADDNNNFFYYSKQAKRTPLYDKVQDTEWYREAINKNGDFIVRFNLKELAEPIPNEKHISFIRGIRDVNSLKAQGIIIFDISPSYFEKSLRNITEKNELDIAIYDPNNQTIIGFTNNMAFDVGQVQKVLDREEYTSTIENIDGKDYIISGIKESRFGWKIISINPFDKATEDQVYNSFIAFIVILMNSLLLFIGSLIISRMITIPIKKLLASMSNVKRGGFKKVEIDTGNNEFGRLIDGYNIMISEIERLINRVVEEQRIKRKAELNVIQEQIKPHFLYNSFDSISSLILSKNNDEAFKMMEALKDYYKTSLSQGSEIISIEEEIGVVRNYLIIQKTRFGDKFDVNFNIDHRVLKFKIPKLILQPLVENSIHHGIRQKRGKGFINITAQLIEENIWLTVQDNGIGMDEETIKAILEKRKEGDKAGFGLRATIERLNIFYGINNTLTIESVPNQGTKIIVTVPIKAEEQVGI